MHTRRFLWFALPTLAMAQFPPRPSPNAAMRTGVWAGKTIQYTVANGHAAVGDILIAAVDRTGALPRDSTTLKLWTGGIIPYTFDAAFVNRDRMLNAMKLWQDATGLQFVERTNQANYIKMVSPAFDCNSFIGMQGGEQVLNMAAGCVDGAAPHELGHAIGLYHEQARLDRSLWIQVVQDNMIATCPFDYNYRPDGASQDLFTFDYGSIMHYDSWSNSRNGYPTMITIPPYIPIGEAPDNNTGLSPTDIETVRRLYGKPARGTTVATFPIGLPITVDGVSYTAPRTFSWTPGSTHTIGVQGIVPKDETTRYALARWSDNGAAQHTVTANADVPVYTANFVRYFRVTAAMALPASGGTVTLDPPSADGFYPQGSYVRVTATPPGTTSFFRWNGIDVFPLSIPEEAGDIGDVNPRMFYMSRPRTITAEITVPGTVNIFSDPPNLTVEVHGQLFRTPYRNTYTPGTSHHVVAKELTQQARGGLIEFSARYVFNGWTGISGTNPAIDFVAPAFQGTALNFTAKFTKQYLADISILGSGTVDASPKSSDNWYNENTVVRFTPQPAAGSRFFNWRGMPANLNAHFGSDVATTDVCANPLVYKMDRPILAQAQMFAVVTPGAKPVVAALASNASGVTGGVSPGEIVVLYGQNLGPADLFPSNLSPAGIFDNCLARTIVYFDGVPAPLIYSFAGQVAAIAPYALAGKSSTQVVLEYKDARSDTITLPVVAARPAFYTLNGTGKGPGAFLDLAYQLITDQNPALRGGYAQLYATGAGQTNPAGTDGTLALDYQHLPAPLLPVRVFVGSVECEVVYAGAAPGAVAGLLQVDIKIPDSAPTGAAVPIVLQVGSFRGPDGVTIAIR